MHVLPARQTSQLVDSGIVWYNVPVPVVSEYCYLGLWFNNTCTWTTHFEKMLAKVQRVKGALMPIWKSGSISVEVKRILLLTCVRPIVEYGSEVWFPSTARQLQLSDKVQTDIIKCAMRCGKERPCSSALLAEWGVKPLHMWLHQRALEYYYRIQRMQGVRLPNQVFTAEWRRPSGAVAVTPWHKYVQSLLCKYGVNVVTAEGRASACKSHVNKQHITCDRSHRGTARRSLNDYIIASADIAMPCQAAARPTAKVGPYTVGSTDHLPVSACIQRPVARRPAKQVKLRLNAQPNDFKMRNGEQSAELEAYQEALAQLGAAYTSTITVLQQQVSAAQLTANAAVQQAHAQLLGALRQAVDASFGFKRVWVGKSFPWWTQELTNAVQARVQAFTQYRESGLVADWDAFDQQRKATAQLIKAAEKQHKQRCEHAITAAYRDRLSDDSTLGEKDMWQLVRRLCPKHVSEAVYSVMQHPSGQTASTPAEKADAFKCHYQRVGSHAAFAAANPQFDPAHMTQVAANVQQYLHDSTAPHAAPPCPLDLPITAAEVSACLQRLRTGKAGNPAEEGIVNELLKYGGNTVADMLLQYCSLMWQLEQVHQVPGTVISMPKKGDLTDPGNYRGITLLSVLYKFYTSVLNQRLIKFAEGEQQEQQQQTQAQQQQQQQGQHSAQQQQQQQQQQQPRATAATCIQPTKAVPRVGLQVTPLPQVLNIASSFNMYSGSSSSSYYPFKP
ncbi:hypothetical protein COO60DRAFT_1482140 [Scenedesmus sp. NREL 46B-D3]|nr:hypothetical protein COO60DRAFT_1482140 [Scenedesmus sp. NREL 46B-D3]